MATLTFGQITDTVLEPLKPPRRLYYGVLAVLALRHRVGRHLLGLPGQDGHGRDRA